jgi:hypothetical protein
MANNTTRQTAKQPNSVVFSLMNTMIFAFLHSLDALPIKRCHHRDDLLPRCFNKHNAEDRQERRDGYMRFYSVLECA